MALAEQRRKELYAKQGRGNQFTSKEDRDKWITKELKSLNKAIRDKQEQIRRLDQDLKNDTSQESKLDEQIKVQLRTRTHTISALKFSLLIASPSNTRYHNVCFVKMFVSSFRELFFDFSVNLFES